MNATNVYKRKAPPSHNNRSNAARTSSSGTATAASTLGANRSSGMAKSGSSPTTLQINNIPVHFPFQPYDVQSKYMKSVLDALLGGQHALLESPTGTGKTLCLLCSTLAWQQAQKGLNSKSEAGTQGQYKAPVIIYASRTHSQLSQVVREMKNTRYRPRHAVLGSREHMCIHPKVNPQSKKNKSTPTSSDINHSCNKLNLERKCLYRNTLEERGPNWHPPCHDAKAGDENQPIRDMEDLISAGKENRVCPFYYTRGLISDAEIIFVPYNYLFDRDARESTLAEVDFANAVLVFDEAHNLEEFASESSSFDLSSNDVAGCVNEVQRALQYLELNPDAEAGGGKLKDNMLRLKSIFLKLETFLLDGLTKLAAGKAVPSQTGETSHPGDFIFDIFRDGAGITHGNSSIFCQFVRQVQDLILEFKGNTSSSATPRLDHFVNCLKRVYGSGSDMLARARSKSYRVHVTKAQPNTGGGFTGGRTISYWCFAPALAMRELAFLKVRSILITSGTLSPLPSFSMELGLDFPVQLENEHVIKPEQIFVRVIGKGVSGKELSSKFGRRDDPEYILELGNTLASLCRNIPGGVLIFFPSYSSLQTCVERWGGPSNHKKANDRGGQFFAARKKQQQTLRYSFPQMPAHFMAEAVESSTPWKRLLSRKAIVLEPRTTSDLNDAIAEFKKFIAMPKSPGCILMGVCRGKISEGIDFTDDMCRAVIVTGLPFAPYLDPKVKLKRDFLDTARASERTPSSDDGGFNEKSKPKSTTTLSGSEWYNQQAHRAVNQAIGRVIRHRNDYGAVLFLDHRFSEPRNKEGLSKWLKHHLLDDSFGASTRSLVQFFKEAKAKTNASSVARPVLQYEESPRVQISSFKNQVTQIAIVSSTAAEGEDESAFIAESRIIKRIDLNQPSIKAENHSLSNNNSAAGITVTTSSSTLADAYNQVKPVVKATAISEESSSVWKDLDSKSITSISRISLKPLSKGSTNAPKKKEDAKRMAKIFFDAAKRILSKEDLLQTQKTLVIMKAQGDKKASQSYVNTTKELLVLLANAPQNDRHRLELVSLLFPLLPVKFRYTFEKLGIQLCWQKSKLLELCKSKLTESDLETIQNLTQKLMVDPNSTLHTSTVDQTSRIILEDLQKILSILVNSGINQNHLFALLPDRYLRKAQAMNDEISKATALSEAKARANKTKGENSVNTVLFQKSRPKTIILSSTASEHPKEDETTNLTQALANGRAINDERKNRVMLQANRHCSQDSKYDSVSHNNPSKRIKLVSDKNTDAVDTCLKKVKHDVYAPPRERLNKKIEANVPSNILCSLCNTHLEEPLMSKCRHYACMKCWNNWLSRPSNTCFQCREYTDMKSLFKVVFAQDGTNYETGFTQICERDDDDELEIV